MFGHLSGRWDFSRTVGGIPDKACTSFVQALVGYGEILVYDGEIDVFIGFVPLVIGEIARVTVRQDFSDGNIQ